MMRKFLAIAGCSIMLGSLTATAQRLCGSQIVQNALIAHDPSVAQKIKQMKDGQQAIAEAYKQQNNALAKSTTTGSAIPVIFHYVLTAAQLATIGGETGVAKRVDSQILVIEHDFNRENKDSTLIPSVFKPYYANVGIHFGLAHTDPNGNSTPGYEIRVSTTDFTDESNQAYYKAKSYTNGGLDAWDNTTYLNIWVINTGTGNSVILGLTNPPSFVSNQTGYTAADQGIVLHYEAVGVKPTGSGDVYISGIDKGRTLTHELGHFFEIWHTWGDDGGLCPGQSGGYDDGIADTPPEADATYGNPSFPDHDACADTATGYPAGFMFMNYMDYVNDKAMQMFTVDQAAVMNNSVNTESHTLTTHPTVLQYPLAVSNVQQANGFAVYPNPSTGLVSIKFDQAPTELKNISVVNVIGQEVKNIDMTGQQGNNLSIDLSAMSKGIYIVRCNFASGTITRKISLQ